MIKAAAYCRVSTEKDEQLNSLANQRQFFHRHIENHPDWTLTEIYVDEGVSGTAVNRRQGFLKMLEDGKAGKFQILLTKEISRFARNTLDSIYYTRKLKEWGIGVIFLNDNINTLDADAELRLTIMASIAQEESRKTSERVKWGQRRQMEKGVVFGHSLLGYTLYQGKLEVEEQGAAACSSCTLSQDHLEHILLQAMKTVTVAAAQTPSGQQSIAACYDKLRQVLQRQRDGFGQLERWRKLLCRLEQEQTKLPHLYLQSHLSEEKFLRENADYQERIQDLHSKIAAASANDKNYNETDRITNQIAYCQKILEGHLFADSFYQTVLEKIVVESKEQMTIFFAGLSYSLQYEKPTD